MISLRHIKNYILKDVNLDIENGELLVLVGPSGAGKTTLLNVVSGLTSYEGQVLFNGKPVDRLPPWKREVGYVFQELLLFPHVTVMHNLLLAMQRLTASRAEKKNRAENILRVFRMERFSGRYPHELSGGEQQRVALARAVATEPKLLLLDEPFVSLDFRTTRYLRQELKKQQRQLGLTTLFVTHNLAEARELGDRIAVFKNGCIEQIGSPKDVWFNQAFSKTGFLEKPNILECSYCTCLGNGLVEVGWSGIKLLVPDDGCHVNRVAILPDEIYISTERAPGPPINRFEGLIKSVHQSDGIAQIVVAVGAVDLRVEMNPEHFEALNVMEGQPVHGILKLRALKGL
jgi:ABC-type Fe3+/spermidine/putrescine transport system ATPase subunit